VLYVATGTGIYSMRLPCECDLWATSNKCQLSLVKAGLPLITAIARGPGRTLYVPRSTCRGSTSTLALSSRSPAATSRSRRRPGSAAQFYAIRALAYSAPTLYAVEESYGKDDLGHLTMGWETSGRSMSRPG